MAPAWFSTGRRVLHGLMAGGILGAGVFLTPAHAQQSGPLWTDPAAPAVAAPPVPAPQAVGPTATDLPPDVLPAPIFALPPVAMPPGGEGMSRPPEAMLPGPEIPSPDQAAHAAPDGAAGALMGGFAGGGMGGQAPNSYRAFWMPDAPVAGQNTRWGMVGQDLSFMVPMWMHSTDMLAINFHVGERHIETGAIQPDTLQPYPHDLWDLRAGLMYMRKLDNGWTAGGMLNVGSASDQPFYSLREMNVTTMAFLRVPSFERNAWTFSLMYAPMSEIPFPIPGVAYLYNPSDDFRANLGIPLSVFWRPSPDWTVDCSYMPIRTVHAKLAYRLAAGWQFFGRYDWNNEGYYLVDRTNWNDRFFIFDQRLSTGLEFRLAHNFTGEFTAGYLFDRSTFEGQSIGGREYNVVGLGAGPYLSATAGVRF